MASHPSQSLAQRDGQAQSEDVEKAASSFAGSESEPSQVSVDSPAQPQPENPDGGLMAWLQVAGAWSLMFNTFGLINTFGVYQTFYESGELFQSTSSNIAWIGERWSLCRYRLKRADRFDRINPSILHHGHRLSLWSDL